MRQAMKDSGIGTPATRAAIVRRVSSEEAFELARAIGGAEGFLVGISSAAAIYAAIEVAKELGSGKKVLALAPDNGERYLSTTLYEFE